MKDRELFRLMQLIPEEYPEETAAFLAAHGKAGESGKTEPVIRQKKAEPQAGILWRVLLPAGAAACLAVLIGTGLWAGLREKPMTAASSEPELTEIAVQTETAPPHINEVTAAVQQTVTNTVTQSAVKNGTVPAVQSSTPAVTAAAEDKPQTTARPQAKPQSTAAPEQQSVPGTTVFSIPPRNPDYPPGDVTMDGRVDLADAQLLLKEYRAVVVEGGNSILTPEQIALGDVYPNTREDDVTFFLSRLMSDLDDDTGLSVIPTDNPISYEDAALIADYYLNMDIAHYREALGDLTVTEYAQYLNLPPEEPELRFFSEPVILQGDTLPADSVSIQNFGDYPVSTENWELQYVKMNANGNFELWYDGKGACEGCEIILNGTRIDEKNCRGRTAEKRAETQEEYVRSGSFAKLTVGDTAVYKTLRTVVLEQDSENWREEIESGYNYVLEWITGQHIIQIRVNKPWPDEILQQIAECFTAYPAN